MHSSVSLLRTAAAALFAVALLAAPVAAPATAQVSADAETAAKAPGDTPLQRDARTAVAKNFYDSTGMGTRFADDLLGIDLSKPVEVIDFPAGTQWFQYVRETATHLGNFFSPSAQALPSCLGISGTGRKQATAVLPEGKGLQSTAAPIVDSWTTPGVSVQTPGGCTQVVVDNAAKMKATFAR